MFQFSGLALLSEYCIFNAVGCPIRKSPDYRLYAATRSLSQLTTSFIASQSQGIHHAPLVALKILKLYLLPDHQLQTTNYLAMQKINVIDK